MSDATLALCPVHSAAPATATCAHCGRFVCERCANPGVEDQRLCDECVGRAGFRASTRSRVALVLATCSFVAVVPGIVAVVLASAELCEIREGRIFPDGEIYARLARNIALLELGALGIAAAAWALDWLGG